MTLPPWVCTVCRFVNWHNHMDGTWRFHCVKCGSRRKF